ncbi:MAG: hypothetical protein IH859_08315, partial [Chloroflexi bacterium]|nr:hypothetical protein [Chloroflexota bacterium]
FAGVIYRETEGNPFFVEEVCKALVDSGALYYQDGEWHRPDLDKIEIPQSVQVAIEARLANLDKDVIATLRMAATLGREFQYNTLLKASQSSEEDLLTTLETAEEAQLLSEVSGKAGGTFSFAHALIPAALISGLSGLRRRRLHGQALAAEEELHPEDYAALAHHAAESGDVEKTLEYSQKAGEAAGDLYAWEDAQFQYKRAIESAEDLGLDERLSHLHEDSGIAYLRQGLQITAAESFQKALDSTSESSRQAEMKSQMGRAYTFVGDQRGLPLLEEARRELNPKTQALPLGWTIAGIARNHHLHGHHQIAIDTFQEAQKIADKLDDTDLQGSLYVHMAAPHQHLTQFEESDKWARKSLQLGRREKSPILEALGLEYLSENSFGTGRWQATLDYADREYKIASEIGELNRMAWIQLNRTWAYRGLGMLEKSEEAGLKGVMLADRVGDKRAALLILSRMTYTLTDIGRFEEADQATEDALERALEIGQIYMIGMSKVCRAYYHIHIQEFQPALDLLDSAVGSLEDSDALWLLQTANPFQVQALSGLGEHDKAAKLAEDTYQRSIKSGAVGTQADIMQIWAQVLFSQGNYDDALDKVTVAIKVAGQENYRLSLGRSHYWNAKILVAQGDTKAAKEAAATAEELFEYCGAQPDLERAQTFAKTIK